MNNTIGLRSADEEREGRGEKMRNDIELSSREAKKKERKIKRKIRMTHKYKKRHCLKNFKRDILIFLMHNDPG